MWNRNETWNENEMWKWNVKLKCENEMWKWNVKMKCENEMWNEMCNKMWNEMKMNEINSTFFQVFLCWTCFFSSTGRGRIRHHWIFDIGLHDWANQIHWINLNYNKNFRFFGHNCYIFLKWRSILKCLFHHYPVSPDI